MEKFKMFIKNYFSKGPKAIFIFILALLTIGAILFGTRKTLYVYIDGKENKIITFRSNLKGALTTNNIVVGPKDKTNPSLDSKVDNKDKIYIKKAVNVEILIDGKKLKVQSAENTVEDMINAEGLKIGNQDEILPSKDELLKEGLKVAVNRIEIKNVKQTKNLEYGTVTKNDGNLQKGNSKVLQEGKSGEKIITTRVVYKNGKPVSNKVVSEVVTKKPVQKIIAMGTAGGYTPSRGGNISYSRAMKMEATAYTADYESTGKSPGDYGFGITATGTTVRRASNGYSTVAVDPRVIPLGTKLYIEGYGYAIAEDTGGAVKGNRIDLYFSSKSEMNNWGLRPVTVYILR